MSKILGDNFDYSLLKYSKDLEFSNQKDNYDNYPVAQMKKFIKNPEAIKKDFLALYSFMKRCWYHYFSEKDLILSGPYQKNDFKVVYVIFLVQQLTQFSVESGKGPRLNLSLEKGGQKKTEQVGITNIHSDYLRRQTSIKPLVSNEPWYHPGRTQCRVPYTGKYGQYMKQYRKNNSLYSSVQCGISGSVNFCLFMYLASLTISGPTINPISDAQKLITSTTTVLLSDGGHNARETIAGLTLVIITLKIWLTDIKLEINKQYKRNVNLVTEYEDIDKKPENYPNDISLCHLLYEKINNFTPKTSHTTQQIFQFVMYSFGVWESFINALYKITITNNPLGVFTNDLNKYNPNILKNKTKYYKHYKSIMYKVWFGLYDKYDKNAEIAIMILTSLDADRHTLHPNESFKEKPSKLFEKVVSEMKGGSDILEKTNKQLTNIIDNCNDNLKIYSSNDYKKIGRKAIEIPFAFKSNSKKNETIYLEVCNKCGNKNFSKDSSGKLNCKNCGSSGDTSPMTQKDIRALAEELLRVKLST